MECAPHFVGVDAQVHRTYGNAGDQADTRRLDRRPGKGLYEQVIIPDVFLHHDISAAADNVQHIHIHVRPQAQLGIPVSGESQLIDEVDAGNADILHGDLKAPQACLHGSFRLQNLVDPERRSKGQRHRRDLRQHEHGVIDVGYAATQAHDPEAADTIDIDAGEAALHIGIELVHSRCAGGSLFHPEGCLQLDHNQVRRASNAEFPDSAVAVHGGRQDLQVQCTLHRGKYVEVLRQRDFDGRIEAGKAAAEQDVVHIQVQGASLGIQELLLVVGKALLHIAQLIGCIIFLGQGQLGHFHGGSFALAPIKVGGEQEIGRKLSAEGDDSQFARIRRITVFQSQEAKLAVAELEKHTRNGLHGACGTGPQQGNGVGVAHGVVGAVAGVALVIVLEHCAQFAVCEGGDGANAVPNAGSGIGSVDLAVNIDIDDLVFLSGILHRQRHRTALNVQTVADVDGAQGVALHVGQGVGADFHHLAVLPANTEVAPELQVDLVVPLFFGKGILIGSFIPIHTDLIGRIILGEVIVFFHSDHTVGGGNLGQIVGDLEAKQIGSRVLLAFLHPVKDHLIGAQLHLLVHHQVDGAVAGIHNDIGAGNYHIRAVAIHGMQNSRVDGGILQQAEVQTGQVNVSGSFIVDKAGVDAVEDDGLTQLTGTEQIEFSAAHQPCIGQLVALCGVVAQHLEFAVLTDHQRFDIEVSINDQFFTGLKLGHYLREGFGFCALFVGEVQVVLIGVDIVHGLHHDGHFIISLAGDIFQHHLQLDISVRAVGNLGIVGVAVAFLQYHCRGHHGEVDHYGLLVIQGGVGVDAVVGGEALVCVLTHRTQVIVQSIGAVGRHVLLVVGVGKVDIPGDKIEDRGCQIVPVAESQLVGRNGGAVHHCVHSVSGQGGRIGIVHSKQGSAVVVAQVLAAVADHCVLDHMGVLVQPVGHLVGGIILEAQRRIVHNTHFHIGNIITGAGHGIADIYHAVQGRCFVQQGQGLGHGQVLDTPGGNDGVAFLGQFHSSRAKAKETVCPSENVLFCFAVGTGDAERGVGCIVIRGGIKQIFVVICLIQLIAFHGVNEEAAVLSGDADLQITVGQLQFIGCVICRQDGSRKHRQKHCQAQNGRQQSFQDIFHNDCPPYLFSLPHTQ